MDVLRYYKRLNLAGAACFIGVFIWRTSTEGSPAWRILIMLALFQALFFFVTLPMLKRRVAEAEKQKKRKEELEDNYKSF